jgi:hypothetical protein
MLPCAVNGDAIEQDPIFPHPRKTLVLERRPGEY